MGPPAPAFAAWRELISRARSGSRGTRADQGGRPPAHCPRMISPLRMPLFVFSLFSGARPLGPGGPPHSSLPQNDLPPGHAVFDFDLLGGLPPILLDHDGVNSQPERDSSRRELIDALAVDRNRRMVRHAG